MCRSTAMWLACGALALTALSSSAQDPEARSRELFVTGREEILRGDVQSGCAKILESHRLAPEAIGPLLNLADCDEQGGHLVIAWRRFRRAAAIAPDEDRRKEYALNRAAALRGRIPRVKLELPPHGPDEMRVFQDGVPLDEAVLAAPLMLDPGSYRFTVTAPEHRERAYDVVLAEGMMHTISLELGAREQPPAAPAKPRPPPRDAPAPPEATSRDGLSAPALAGWITGGVGAAALVAGIVTGALVGVYAGVYDEHCDDGGACDDEGLDAASKGKTLAIVSPVSLSVGAAALAVAIPLLVTSPEMSGAARLRLAPDGSFALFFDGAF